MDNENEVINPEQEVPTDSVPADEPVVTSPAETTPVATDAADTSTVDDVRIYEPVNKTPAPARTPAREKVRPAAAGGLAPDESKLDGVHLGIALCRELLNAGGMDSFHGGVRPDNITISGEKVILGRRLDHGVGEFTPQELEFMAPELFWDGLRSPTADVYSVGLVLYAIFNRGRLPFWPEKGDITPKVRADSLQRRMSNEELPAPVEAGEELCSIILRCLSFGPEERWHDAAELRGALGDLREVQTTSEDIAAVIAALAQRGAGARSNNRPTSKKPARRSDNLQSPFIDEPETPLPKVRVRRNRRRTVQIIAYIVLALCIVALILLLRQCNKLSQAITVPTPVATATSEPSGEGVKVISGKQGDAEAVATSEPTATPEPTPEATPVLSYEYIAVRDNVSWSQAVEQCRNMGGELAMPSNAEEFQKICAACQKMGLTYVWLGAYRDANGDWLTTSGEKATFFAWGTGEPSVQDTDGTHEDYYLLWNLNDNWCGNDSRENPLDGYWNAYAGKIGYVCRMGYTAETGTAG